MKMETQVNEQKSIKKIQFKMTDEDTCMRTWTFEIQEKNGEKVVVDSNIEFNRQGCSGHPKTISALIKGRILKDINVEDLKKTNCFRQQSCGMSLAACIEAMR